MRIQKEKKKLKNKEFLSHCLVGSTCVQIETKRAIGYKICRFQERLDFGILYTPANEQYEVENKHIPMSLRYSFFRHTVPGVYIHNLNCGCVGYKSNDIMHSTHN